MGRSRAHGLIRSDDAEPGMFHKLVPDRHTSTAPEASARLDRVNPLMPSPEEDNDDQNRDDGQSDSICVLPYTCAGSRCVATLLRNSTA
jgi:hypothetical protein